MTIDVLMLTDNNYISQTRVAMYSASKNTSSKTKIVFTILCDKDLNATSKKRLMALQEMFSNIKVDFYEIEESALLNVKSNHRVPQISCYRLIGAKILNAKKAIYLDSDLIVQMDLMELYDIDIENYYIAGVKDLYLALHPNFALQYADNYNLKNFLDYVNCGVLLMNLEKMRKHNIVDAFLNELNHENLWFDQDIINRVCSGKIHLLGWRFNHVTLYTREEYEWNFNLTECKSEQEIIHFCGPDKPWDNRYSKMADYWWNIAKEALEEVEYKDLHRIASIGYGSEKVAEILQRCLGVETIIIVGYSEHGIFVRNALLKYGVTAKIFFCDNNQKKRELMLTDKKVYSPEEAVVEYRNAIWVNVVQKHRDEIVMQLRSLGIPDERIINYLYE